MAQKGLAVNHPTTPADRFMSRGLEMLAIGNTDLRDEPKVNNQPKKPRRPAREKVENQLGCSPGHCLKARGAALEGTTFSSKSSEEDGCTCHKTERVRRACYVNQKRARHERCRLSVLAARGPQENGRLLACPPQLACPRFLDTHAAFLPAPALSPMRGTRRRL